MPIAGGGAKVDVVVYPARISPLAEGTIVADGTEQTIVEYGAVGRVSGYIDLSKMQGSDTIKITQYMKLKSGGTYMKYADGDYSGVQNIPVLYITGKESDYGVKLTLKQSAGVMKTYDYNFLKEV